jgi:hypothetical protein
MQVEKFQVGLSKTIKSDNFFIDNVESPRLKLKVGVKYIFEVNTPGLPFYRRSERNFK